MHVILRWFGPQDSVSLSHIRQIPYVNGVASALMSVDPGVAWRSEEIDERQSVLADHGLSWTVVESIPLHEDIKLGLPTRDGYIDAWCETMVRLGRVGVHVICYNFMPVFDWMRTNLQVVSPDGSQVSEYKHEDFLKIDITEGITKLPVWRGDFDAEHLHPRLAAYDSVDEERLWDNLAYFLERVVPVAREAESLLAIHPDDPPWPIFGLPRIMTSGDSFERVLSLNDDPANGLTLCTGSLGASRDNDVIAIARQFAPTGRIHFAHLRNVLLTGDHSFIEAPHPRGFGSVDLIQVVDALVEGGFDGPMRPDHGRMIWGEQAIPGYGLYDRALGAMYLAGAWEMAGGRID